MPLSKITAIAAVIALTAISASAPAQTLPTVVVDPAIATMTNDELVKARQDAMKEDGGILRTAAALTGDDAVAAATTLLQNFTNFPALFREGSITPDSHALPIIWQQWDEFEGIFKDAQLGATKMLEAALAEDDLAYGDAVRGLTQICGECHQTYRGR
ncbi:MAG TPA: cytochrome c [Devosia sp.]|nr:cytochrome c [Devosia sp.]